VVYVYYPDGSLAQDHTVAADENGNFEDSYVLPGEDAPVAGIYKVVALGQVSGSLFRTNFSDAAVTDFSQCRNDINNDDTPDAGCSWTTGALNANNSILSEGSVVAHRLIHSGISGSGVHTFTFEYDFTKGGKYAYDFPSNYDATPLSGSFASTACQGLSGANLTHCNALFSAGVTVTVPSDGNNDVNSHEYPGTRQWRIGCNPACSSADIVGIGPAVGSTSGDSSKTITVTVTTSATSTDVGIWMGMHLACGNDCPGAPGSGWGSGKGASSVSGAPFHFKYISLDGASVGNRDNQIQSGTIVVPVTPSVTTELHTAAEVPINGSVDLGSTIHDKAVISPTNVTGTVTFTFYSNGSCQGDGTSAGTVDVVNGVAHPSTDFGPLAAGSYSFKAHFTSGNPLKWTDADSPCEPFTVNKARPTVTTEVHDASHNDVTNGSVSLGSTVHDRAVVSSPVAAFTPTGTVTFTFYSNGSCDGDGSSAGTVALDGWGVAHPSDPEGPLGAGSYSFKASYGGDSNFEAAEGPCEPFTVNKADLAISTDVHDANHAGVTSVPLGSTVHDKATVTGIVPGFAPANKVSFTFYRNGSCSGDGEDAGQVALDSSGVAHPSTAFGPLAAGSYSFKASIAGDDNYNGATSDCEPFTVNKARPTVTTEVHQSDHTVVVSESLDATVHDSATVSSPVAAFTPTGSVTFTFYSNGSCQGDGTSAGTVALDGWGVAHPSDPEGPLGAGSYSFRARYSGDDNFEAAWSECEPFTISTITINKVANGGNDTFGFQVSGPTSASVSITTTGTPGTGSATLIVLAGSYTVSETAVPSGWQLVAISCNGSGNGSFTLQAGTNVTCNVENTHQAATRTQGFWATHTNFANTMWNGAFPNGYNLCGTKLVTALSNPGQNVLMGGFWSNIAKKTNGTKRTSLDSARMALLQQLLAALLNKYGLGADDGGLIASAEQAYCGTNVTDIKNATSALSNWNKSGDAVPLNFPISAATPKDSQKQADKKFWDTTK
jgi:stalled ribosome alternative rescue factor ArfA